MLKIRAGTSKMLVKKSPLTCIRQTNKSISIIKEAWSKVKVVSRRISYSPRLHSKCSSQQTSQDFHTATYGYRFITIKQDFHTPHVTGMCIKRGITVQLYTISRISLHALPQCTDYFFPVIPVVWKLHVSKQVSDPKHWCQVTRGPLEP